MPFGSLGDPPTCCGGAGCVEGLLGQVEDLLSRVGRGDGVLALPGLHRVVLFTVVVCIKEPLEPLDKVQVVLKPPFDQLLYGDNLGGG